MFTIIKLTSLHVLGKWSRLVEQAVSRAGSNPVSAFYMGGAKTYDTADVYCKDTNDFIGAKYLVVSGRSIYPYNDRKHALVKYHQLHSKYGKYGYVRLYKTFKPENDPDRLVSDLGEHGWVAELADALA